jgi:hypothetical protein
MYFVHTYCGRPSHREDVLAVAELRGADLRRRWAARRFRLSVPSGKKRRGGSSYIEKFRGVEPMTVLPAIDLKDGKCVRLFKGDFETAHQVADDPLEVARAFSEAGARYIHMVDLDGARAAESEKTRR